MRRPHIPISRSAVFSSAVALAISVAPIGCAHAIPADHAVEATLPAAPLAPTLARALRVVTFNLHGQTGANVIRALTLDPALREADVLVLEEVHGQGHCSVACEVGTALGMHAVFEPEFVDRGGTDGVAILARTPIESTSIIELPYYNVHFNDEHRKAALAATLRVDGRAITVYAVHLTNRLTVSQRRRQMQPILEHAERQHTPIIIAGDFNTSPFTWIAHVIPILTTTQDDRFEELMRAHGFATPVAESGPTSRYLAMKLDGIYTRGFETRAFATSYGLDISDHFALWAQVAMASR